MVPLRPKDIANLFKLATKSTRTPNTLPVITRWAGGYDDDSMSCPNCAGAHLHISRMSTCNDFICRQGGYAIEFWCEGCDVLPELCIQEHKGSTCLFWRDACSKQEI